MPPLPTEQLTEQQKQALAEFVAARGQPTGPWNVLLRSPELMKRTRGLSDYLRFESILPGYLREFVLLMTARQWGQSYEWNAHYPLALDEGFSAEMAQAIAGAGIGLRAGGLRAGGWGGSVPGPAARALGRGRGSRLGRPAGAFRATG